MSDRDVCSGETSDVNCRPMRVSTFEEVSER